MRPHSAVPDEFPREPYGASLAGAQPKITVRLDGGRYHVGLSDDELLERYQACEDLAQQLASYCVRKQSENPSWSREFNLSRARNGVAQKVARGLWDISGAELSWVMSRVQQMLGW